MNWVLSVLAGIAVAVLVLYFIKKNQAPVAIETYVQQPVRKGADISEQDSMLVAVGLQALYTPRPSVMDTSEISKDAWLASQAAATGGAASPASAQVQQAAAAEQAPMGAGSGMAGSPMWSAGGMASGGQAAQMQVFLPGGPTAAEQLQGPAPTSSGAAAPRARTQAEIDAANATAQDEAARRADKNAALRADSARAQSAKDKIAVLKAEAERKYREVWLPARPSASRTDTAANRTAYVASLVAELQLNRLNHDNYFESNWKQTYGSYAGDAAKTAAFNAANTADLQILQDAQDTIDALDDTWQNSNAVDCYPLPWPQYERETACSKTCGPGKKTQYRKYVEPQNGGQACPPPASRDTQVVDCNAKPCVRTVQPSTPVCAPGYTFRSTDNKCTLVSQVSPSEGCTTGYTYNSSTGYCTKTGYVSQRPSAPTGYTFNTTTNKFEKTADPTFTCTTAGFNLYTGVLGFTYPPECEGYV